MVGPILVAEIKICNLSLFGKENELVNIFIAVDCFDVRIKSLNKVQKIVLNYCVNLLILRHIQ